MNHLRTYSRVLKGAINEIVHFHYIQRQCHTGQFHETNNPQDKGPLDGIRILDLTRILAGPFCTMVLSDLGAEVIKVENPNGGDDTRSWGPPFVGDVSCYYLSVNRNKKSIAVNFKSEKGVSIVKDLVKQSDVLVENFVPGVLDAKGLGYDSLKTIAPKLIYCSLTGHGPTGPYKTRPGYDVLAAAMAGLTHATGPEGGEPCKVGVAMTDVATGLFLHGAILAALMQRMKTNKGQRIDCNLLSTQVACMINLASNYLNAGLEPKRRGTAHESIVPYRAFQSKDGYLAVSAGNDVAFKKFCSWMDLNHIANEQKFATNKLRVENREELESIIGDRIKLKSTKEWLNILEGAPFPYSPINTLKETFSDPQVIHNNLVKELEHDRVGKIKVISPSVSYSDCNNSIRSPPPDLGQHTWQVLHKHLHVTKNEFYQMVADGVIGGEIKQ